MRCALLFLGVAVCLSLAPSRSPAWARYARPDLEKVPVEELVANLTKEVEAKPKDAGVRMNLARVHGMAYALKAEALDALKKAERKSPWLGYEPSHVPFHVQPTDDEAKLKAARQHLDKAIERFDEAVKLDAKNLTARLGLAWCLDQAGRKADAIKAYREVIEAGWTAEKDLKTAGLGWRSIVAEAAGYLEPHLDPKKDEKEIAELKDRVEKLSRVSRPITPIAVPLADGLEINELLDREARVRFDVDGQRRDARWTWITPRAGWLAYDRGRTGRVDSGLQLFGNVTFWLFWDDGYQALAALDRDRDGRLSGEELEGLAIWHDRNANGTSEPGEVRPVGEYGITALDCRGQRPQNSGDVAAFAPRGVEYRDGRTRPTYDVILREEAAPHVEAAR